MGCCGTLLMPPLITLLIVHVASDWWWNAWYTNVTVPIKRYHAFQPWCQLKWKMPWHTTNNLTLVPPNLISFSLILAFNARLWLTWHVAHTSYPTTADSCSKKGSAQQIFSVQDGSVSLETCVDMNSFVYHTKKSWQSSRKQLGELASRKIHVAFSPNFDAA